MAMPKLPAAVGVPLIWPVLALIVSPARKPSGVPPVGGLPSHSGDRGRISLIEDAVRQLARCRERECRGIDSAADRAGRECGSGVLEFQREGESSGGCGGAAQGESGVIEQQSWGWPRNRCNGPCV